MAWVGFLHRSHCSASSVEVSTLRVQRPGSWLGVEVVSPVEIGIQGLWLAPGHSRGWEGVPGPSVGMPGHRNHF